MSFYNLSTFTILSCESKYYKKWQAGKDGKSNSTVQRTRKNMVQQVRATRAMLA